jgi:hypothetical protein
MFNVTPIGSCRITTPLRLGQSDFGIGLNRGRCYGYCHSPAEAVQLARFMRGEATIPHDVWPLISRSHDLDTISAQEHVVSDLYVVELASAKELTIDGVSIQLNYLKLAYGDFFADVDRTQRFWALAEGNDSKAKLAFLDREWSATVEQKAQAETLRRIRLDLVTRESLRQNIRELARILPDVLFVSHVDARKSDGTTIGSRSDFINLVREEVRAAGLKFYDPTDLMAEFGQSAAIEDESAGLAHFTAAFSNAIMEDWMHRFIAPATDEAMRQVPAGGIEEMLRPQVDAAMRNGRLADMRARLDDLSPESGPAQTLLTEFGQRQAEMQSGFLAATTVKADNPLDNAEIVRLVGDAGLLGLFDTALDYAARARGGLRALPAHLLIKVGRQAAQAGDIDNAFEFVLAACSRNSDLPRARNLLVDLAIQGEIDLLGELDPEQSVDILARLPPAQKLRLLQLNGAAPSAAVTATSSAQEVAEFAVYLAEHQDIVQAAKIIAVWRDLQEGDRVRDEGLVTLLDQWVASARVIDAPLDRVHALAAIRQADPRHQAARAAIRDARVDLITRIRAAGKEGDLEALDALTAEASILPASRPELDLWRARVRFDRGEFEKVIELGQSAADSMSDRISVWVLLMRAANKTENPGKAAEFASKVIDLACAKTEWLRAEAEAVRNAHAMAV